MAEQPLSELVKITHGFAFPGEDFTDEPTSDLLLTPGNFAIGGGFQLGKGKYFRGSVPPEYVLPAGELVVTMTDLSKASDTLGYPAIVPDLPGLRVLHNQRVGRVVFKKNDAVSKRFLYYMMCTREYRHEILASATGTGVKHTAPVRIEAFKFDFPPLPEQRAIAGVLGALDDKIEVNRKTARVLEGIARAAFTSWFVDFDPVRRTPHPPNAAAAHPTTFPRALPADLAALFPTRLVDSPIGEVPEGWRVGTLGDLLSLSRDAIDPGDHPSEDFDHFSIPAFDTGQMPSKDRGETIKSQKFVVTADCVLVSKLNPRTPRVWLPPAAGPRRQVASTEFLVCTGNKAKKVSREFIYCMATSEPLIEHLTTHASGTSNSHQRVRPQDFLDFQCVEPPVDVLRGFTQAATPIFGRIATSRAQSATLVALRDALLPKLISGELRIADAEKIVGRAV
ncbi:MAG: restriction endonuclease subunit S [Planctomycetota bacterium]